MLNWITQNIGNIIVVGFLTMITIQIIRKMIQDKKKEKSSCGCNCGHCGMNHACHNR